MLFERRNISAMNLVRRKYQKSCIAHTPHGQCQGEKELTDLNFVACNELSNILVYSLCGVCCQNRHGQSQNSTCRQPNNLERHPFPRVCTSSLWMLDHFVRMITVTVTVTITTLQTTYTCFRLQTSGVSLFYIKQFAFKLTPSFLRKRVNSVKPLNANCFIIEGVQHDSLV